MESSKTRYIAVPIGLIHELADLANQHQRTIQDEIEEALHAHLASFEASGMITDQTTVDDILGEILTVDPGI